MFIVSRDSARLPTFTNSNYNNKTFTITHANMNYDTKNTTQAEQSSRSHKNSGAVQAHRALGALVLRLVLIGATASRVTNCHRTASRAASGPRIRHDFSVARSIFQQIGRLLQKIAKGGGSVEFGKQVHGIDGKKQLLRAQRVTDPPAHHAVRSA